MPNWCSNIIEIKGPKDKVKAIWDKIETHEDYELGLLNALVPMPDEIRATMVGEGDDWYDWSLTNWGTKWEISNEGLEYAEEGDSGIISGWFESAWSPPYEALLAFHNDNPDIEVKLDYHEPGMAFVGRLHLEDGVELVDEHVNYAEFTSSTVRDAIGEEMDDTWNISQEMAEWEEEAEYEAADAQL